MGGGGGCDEVIIVVVECVVDVGSVVVVSVVVDSGGRRVCLVFDDWGEAEFFVHSCRHFGSTATRFPASGLLLCGDRKTA